MKILLSVLIFLVLLVGGGYSGIWFYFADKTKSSVEESLKFAQILVGGDVTYSSVNVTGFPLYFDVEIEQLGMTVNIPGEYGQPDQQVSWKNKGVTALRVPLLEKTIGLEMSEMMHVDYQDGLSEGQKSLDVIFANTPLTELTLERELIAIISEHLAKTYLAFAGEYVPYLSEPLSVEDVFRTAKVDYKGDGVKVVDADNREVMFSDTASHLKVSKRPSASGKEKIQLSLSMGANNVHMSDSYYDWMAESYHAQLGDMFDAALLDKMVDLNRVSGDISYNVDFIYDGPLKNGNIDDMDLKVKQFAIVSERYAINSDGNISADPSDPLPFGWYRVNLMNYPFIIDHGLEWYGLYVELAKAGVEIENQLMEGQEQRHSVEDMEALKIENPEAMAASLRTFVQQISNENTDEENTLLVFKRQKAGELYINDRPMDEVFGLLMQHVLAASVEGQEVTPVN